MAGRNEVTLFVGGPKSGRVSLRDTVQLLTSYTTCLVWGEKTDLVSCRTLHVNSTLPTTMLSPNSITLYLYGSLGSLQQFRAAEASLKILGAK